MTVNQSIKELLIAHDCVIIPDLGAFIANPQSAQVENKSVLHPPKKKIAFNSSIQQNDGLLAKYIEQKEKIGYTAALIKISVFVEDTKSKLNQRRKVFLDQIGTFSADNEGNIIFEADYSFNFQLDSYGLGSLLCKPLIDFSSGSLFQDRPAIPSAALPKKIKWKKILALPVLALLICASYCPSLIDSNISYSSLVPFSTKPIAPAPIEEIAARTPEVTYNNERYLAEDAKILANVTPEHYFLVAACFENLINAEHMVDKLRAKGFKAFISGKRKNMYVVSYDSFRTKTEALRKLAEIQYAENESAWILYQ